MTFPRSIRTVLAVALFGLVQFGLVADARADLPSASTLAQNALTHAGVVLRPAAVQAVHRLVAAGDPRHDREHACTRRAHRRSLADGRSLYFNRNFNGRNPASPKVDEDIFVSYRSEPEPAVGRPGGGRGAQHAQLPRAQRGVLARRVDAVLLERPAGGRRRRGPRSLRLANERTSAHTVRTRWYAADQPRPGGQQRERRHRPRLLRRTASAGPTSSTSRATGPGGPGLLDIYASTRGRRRGRSACRCWFQS